MEKILVIEDEKNVARVIKKGLQEFGYTATIAPNGALGIDLLMKNSFDLVILDIIMPGMNGIEVCKKIRSEIGKLPVLILTALGSTENVVSGLESGADDYLVKPFKLKELLARVRALLRRSNTIAPSDKCLQIADLTLDLNSRKVVRSGTNIKLTSTEYRLLEYFMKNQCKVISRTEILENVWGITFDMSTNVVDVYVNYLRNKIDKEFDPKLIGTVIGMGYIMEVQNVKP